jgi:hypothetical protein
MEAADLFVARRCSAEALIEEVSAKPRSSFVEPKYGVSSKEDDDG